MKLVPVTVKVKAGPPAIAEEGDIELTVATGFGAGPLLPPPPPQPARITAEKATKESPRRILKNLVLATIA